MTIYEIYSINQDPLITSLSPSQYYILQVFVLDPKNGVTFSETSNRTKVEQEKNSNQKYTGVGYIPDYDGYIS